MKMSMFETKEQRAQWARNMADAIESNGLRQMAEELEDAVSGKSKAGWLKMNGISEDNAPVADQMWSKHIWWLKDQCLYLRKKVKKYRKMAEEVWK